MLSYQTQKGFEITNFELEVFINKWLATFQIWSKTTMVETKKFENKENKVLFQKLLYCIHSNQVKKKQGSHEVKRLNSSCARNIGCTAIIHL